MIEPPILCIAADEYAYDEANGYCYHLAAGTANINQINAKFICDEDENNLDILSDDQLFYLAKLITNKTGSLSILMNGSMFWTSTIRSLHTLYFADGSIIQSVDSIDTVAVSPFDNLLIPPSMTNKNEDCFSLQYNKTRRKFNGNSADCGMSLHVLCFKKVCLTNKTAPARSIYQTAQRPGVSPDSLLQIFQRSKARELKKYYNTVYRSLDLAKLYDTIFEVMWYSKLPCFDTIIDREPIYAPYGFITIPSKSMLRSCLWKGQSVPCAAIFTTFPTDSGMCCTFNMEAADNIFKEGKYKNIINKMQKRDKESTVYESKELSYYVGDNGIASQAGINNGLVIYLDGHKDLVSDSTVNDDSQGFSAIIGSPNEYPLLKEKKILIRPGHYNLIGISATLIQSSEDLKSIPANKRYCYFPDEFTDKLSLHKNYSQANCLLECQMRYASINDDYVSLLDFVQQEGELSFGSPNPCTPWFLPMSNNDNTTICSPWEAKDYALKMQSIPGVTCDHCYPDCTLTKYDSQVTALPFRSCDAQIVGTTKLCEIIKSSGKRTYERETYDAAETDIAMVQFYFESSTAIQFTRDIRMSTVDFLGLVGGFVGLCNGFSFCSAVEIFFWFTAMWWKIAKEEKRKKLNSSIASLGITKVNPMQ